MKENKIIVYSSGKLIWNEKEYKCALGLNGVSADKQEGDGATPVGCFPLREVYYRADRLNTIKTNLPVKILNEEDGWCDEPKDSAYNKFIKLPYPANHENLWREDNIYNIIAVVGYNDSVVIKGAGSAIFMHIARLDYSPTEGCIALKQDDLLEILNTINKDTLICIKNI